MAILFAVILFDGDVKTQPEPPNIEGWTIVASPQLDARPGDYLKGLVGLKVLYQNPNDKNEFVKIYYRQIGLVSERPNENKKTGEGGRSTLVGNSGYTYHSKEERDALNRVQKATDSFALVHWKIAKDQRTGQDILLGKAESWLLNSNGTWTYDASSSLGAIAETPLSEPSKNDKHSSVVVGVRYTLGDTVHIVRVDQDDLKASAKTTKDKGAKNAK